MAHMKEGSVAVAKGDTVTTGQLLGKVGNSGNTSEPHLHIHAELDGKGVPLTFDGRFLVRNQLVKTGGK
ncbi:M23 family metallopeptidase [Sporosarcina sp. OR05]|uniref:M23 family metallopeptidase n=1 Tax=Sporosarcina sp. OR05 TaxID=2969819 RepID=UPI00352BB308